MTMGDNKFEPREPQFAEYSLWNDSTYSIFNVQPFNRIEFMRPVSSSIFLSPPNLDLDGRADVIDEGRRAQVQTRNSPGFERYMKRALKVVTREDLFKDPTLFKKDPDSDDSEAGSSFDRSRDEDIFLRPPRPRWRTAQQVTGRGRRKNLMQRRLEQALSQPARIERGASMMQRMGWEGGALGRGGGGITEPIAPDPYYANNTAGFGLATDSAADSQDSGSEGQTKRPKGPAQKTKKKRKEDFKINALQYIREFVKNDLQIELFFESKLFPKERKHIHEIVAKLMGEESNVVFNSPEMEYLVEDIERRNCYILGTQSEGEAPNRQICIYKEATERMYLVTPDDVRHPPAEEQEEETNPFLQSITRNLKNDTTSPKEHTLLDRIIDYFVEFTEHDNYTEFRFLGAYNIDEIDVMSEFFGMVSCIIKKGSHVDCPERLARALEKGFEFTADEDVNGFVSVKKWFKVDEDKTKDNVDHEEIEKIENVEVKIETIEILD